ncbi:GntR family transcriptional regulator (plasmid) [Geminicoccaceae bacterium 1502E]|nr:GntR family transcriptional regulator [Geminicoccaceae bacterium 1502E]
MRQAIVEQALRPGDRLPEDAIGDCFGVSRTSVRAALARLHAERLVEARRNRVAIVASPDPTEAQEIFDMRRCLEQEVARRLAGRLTAAQVETLEQHVRLEEQTSMPDSQAASQLAGDFHRLLAGMVNNRILTRYVSELLSRSSLILALYGQAHSTDCAVSEHRAIVAALSRGDAAAAVQAMQHHLGTVEKRSSIKEDDARNYDVGAILKRYAVKET